MKNNPLNEFVDFDIAILAIGQSLGIFPEGHYATVKHINSITWTRNPLGESMWRILAELVSMGYIVCDEPGGKYKTNEKFNYVDYFEKSMVGKSDNPNK